MGNVKFRVWDNPPDGEIALHIRETALNVAKTLGDLESGERVLKDGFGDWPDVMRQELLQLREKFKSRL